MNKLLTVGFIVLLIASNVMAKTYEKKGSDEFVITEETKVDAKYIQNEIERLNLLIAENQRIIQQAIEERDYLINMVQ